jgi:mono/diheme cytochrome c family protein
MPEWLARELNASLAPVDAPAELRERIFRPPAVMPARRVSAFLIAAAMVVLSAGTVWLSARQPARVAPARWSPAIRAQAGDHNCALCHTL